MERAADPLDLAPDQKYIARLVEQLLGQTVADRYFDFCQIAGGVFRLRVSRPIAAHALRELDSTLRQSLEVPMEATITQTANEEASLREVRKDLLSRGFRPGAVDRAVSSLRSPVHEAQIRKICERLGLSPDGNIADSWVSISKLAGKAHERSFHLSLSVDSAFRENVQAKFDVVIRTIALALQARYSALMKRAEHLANMADVGQAVSLYAKEIPGALPLQWHFFDTLKRPEWLPHLIERHFLGEPLPALELDRTGDIRFRSWPASTYLRRMAKSDDPETRRLVAKVIENLGNSVNSDIRQDATQIIASLPSKEAAAFSDILVGWLEPGASFHQITATQSLVILLAEQGYGAVALKLAKALFQVFDSNGQVRTLHPQHLYEHNLPKVRDVLATCCGSAALEMFCELLYRVVIVGGKFSVNPVRDYTEIIIRPLDDDQMARSDLYEALRSTVRQVGVSLLTNRVSDGPEVVRILESYSPKVFKRLAVHILAKRPDADPASATRFLLDENLLAASWCQQDYGALAKAWYPSLPADKQRQLLELVEDLPNKYRRAWKERFAAHNGRAANTEDERAYEAMTFRDAVWHWHTVLPKELREKFDLIVHEFQSPDAWRHRLLAEPKSPLSARDFESLPVTELVELLRDWRPTDAQSPKRETMSALAQELRQAVAKDVVKYAEAADQFAVLAPIYVRNVLTAMHGAAQSTGAPDRKQVVFPWVSALRLVQTTLFRVNDIVDPEQVELGDDPNWLWACNAAVELLNAGLRHGKDGISYDLAGIVQNAVLSLCRLAPRSPETDDFEQKFSEYPYFAAQHTLRGAAIELCFLLMHWRTEYAASTIEDKRVALARQDDIRGVFESELMDRSLDGRVPRAVMGRYLSWLHFFGPDWTKSHLGALLPRTDEALHNAAWLGHFLHDHAVPELLPQLYLDYEGEISLLATERTGRDVEYREERLAGWISFFYLNGQLTGKPDDLLGKFLSIAPSRLRRRIIWDFGQQLCQPRSVLPDEQRARIIHYWETRLSAAENSANREAFRTELNAIGQWCDNKELPEQWRFHQLLRVLSLDIVPDLAFAVIDWLAKISADHVDKALEVLAALIRNRNADQWTYLGQETAIEQILKQGLERGEPQTVNRSKELISFLASVGQTKYLSLLH